MATVVRTLLRAALPYAIALAIAFALGLAGGFVYARDPIARTLDVHVDREAPANAADEATVAGEVAGLDGSRLTIETDDGPLAIDLKDITVEQLVRTDDAGIEVGASVNVGGEQTPFGLALSGVVAIEDDGSP